MLCIAILKPQRKKLFRHHMLVNTHPHWTNFQFFELQIILLPPLDESSLEWFPDSVNACFELILSVSGPLCYDLCRQFDAECRALSLSKCLPETNCCHRLNNLAMRRRSLRSLSYIPLNHGNVLPSLKHNAIAVLDTSFIENTSDIQQCFGEGFS